MQSCTLLPNTDPAIVLPIVFVRSVCYFHFPTLNSKFEPYLFRILNSKFVFRTPIAAHGLRGSDFEFEICISNTNRSTWCCSTNECVTFIANRTQRNIVYADTWTRKDNRSCGVVLSQWPVSVTRQNYRCN